MTTIGKRVKPFISNSMTEKAGNGSTQKLQKVRELLRQAGLNGFLVPRADEWQGEYVPARAERLSWLTGFTGSAGMALVGESKAAVYSDSRYTEQMKTQVDSALFEDHTASAKNTAADWLIQNTPKSGKIGYDPRLHTVSEIKRLQEKLAEHNIELVAHDNLVDAAWNDQPDHPDDKVVAYPEKYAGQPSAEKREAIAKDLREGGAKAALLTQPDSIAWLLNIRGSDVPHVPVALSYALVHENGDVDWFIPAAKVDAAVKQHIGNHVQIHEFSDMEAVLKLRAQAAANENKKIHMDMGTGAIWFKTLLEGAGATVEHADDPTVARKALKNDVERKHIREAHVKDGVALVKFWKWIDAEAKTGKLTELDAVAKLHSFRKQQDGFKDDSFDAIVGWADHGAVVHYRAEPETNKTITKDSLLLVDSGGQYLGGTTDNTRTRAIGTPSEEMRESFTRVLKGHIAVANARFAEGTTGRDIDMLARQFLRKAGLEFGHGTGHGVGSYLSVHEAGAGISSRFDKPLKPGMLISNEPGFYKSGEYGIRIENLVFVEETGDDTLKYKFNTVSLTPIDQKLIDVDLLDADEIKWLNDYHKEVYDTLSPHLDENEKDWLKKETAPIMRGAAP